MPWPRTPGSARPIRQAATTSRRALLAGAAADGGGARRLYRRCVASSGDLRVTAGGRVSLPAEVCARWNLGDGGQVVYLDLGDALLLVPGAASHRRRLLGAVTEAGVAGGDRRVRRSRSRRRVSRSDGRRVSRSCAGSARCRLARARSDRHVLARIWHAGPIAASAGDPAPPLTCVFVVVGTGVDPVTSRFSGARSTN